MKRLALAFVLATASRAGAQDLQLATLLTH
jgi:hypothetical protein